MLGVHRRRKTFHVKALDFDRTLPIQAKARNDDWGRPDKFDILRKI